MLGHLGSSTMSDLLSAWLVANDPFINSTPVSYNHCGPIVPYPLSLVWEGLRDVWDYVVSCSQQGYLCSHLVCDCNVIEVVFAALCTQMEYLECVSRALMTFLQKDEYRLPFFTANGIKPSVTKHSYPKLLRISLY